MDPLAGPVERLAWELRRLRERAGRPSYRELAQRAHVSRSTLAEAATGIRLPTLETTVAYAVACGGDRAEWERRWREAADELERTTQRCPYPGLTPLRDADLFFGRTQLVEDLVRAVKEAAVCVVLGASGSGKSSLLAAGLVPALEADGVQVTVLTPGAHPMERLREGGRSVLVVDQFEEVFTLCEDDGERAEFLDEITDLGADACLVIGVRTDFYGRFAEHPGLVAALRHAVHLSIGPISATELRDIVVKPAARVGLKVEPELVAAVLAEAAGQPGALPLVAHALRETWGRRSGDTLRPADYEATGGVREAIAQTAERVYADLDEDRRDLARAVLLRLTALGEGTEDTRRRIDRDELTGIGPAGGVDAVLDRLAAGRLIVVDHDQVEVAHEALIRHWPRLREWLTEDREALYRHRRLNAAADEWDRQRRDDGYLYSGTRLSVWDGQDAGLNDLERAFLAAGRERAAAEQARARRKTRISLTGLSITAAVVSVLAVLAFVQAVNAEAERDRAVSRKLAADARRQLATDAELALLLSIKAYETAPTAEADLVLRQAVIDARVREASQLGLGGEPVQSAAVSPDGRRIATASGDAVPGGPLLGGTVRLWESDGGRWRPSTLEIPSPGEVQQLTFGPDARHLAIRTTDGIVTVWEVSGASARSAGEFRPDVRPNAEIPAGGVAFSPDGRRIAATAVNKVFVWELGAGEPAVELTLRGRDRSDPLLADVSFSPDGGRLATGGGGAPLQIWDLNGGKPRVVRTTSDYGMGEVAFSPAGTWIVSTDDQVPRIWNLERWPAGAAAEPQAELGVHGGGNPMVGMAFSPDGRRLATIGLDRAIRVWTVGTERNPLILRAPGSRPVKVAFAPDGRTLVSVGNDGAVRRWDVSGLSTSGAVALPGMPRDTYLPVVSSDGGTVAVRERGGETGSSDLPEDHGTIRVWRVGRGTGPVTLAGPRESAQVYVLSPDGRLLATGAGDPVRDGTKVRLWDLAAGGRQIPVLRDQGSSGAVTSLAFSSDGRSLAAAGDFGTRVWRVNESGATTPVTGWERQVRGRPQRALALSPDGRWLANARTDGTRNIVAVWDLTGRRAPKILHTGGRAVLDLLFSADGRQLTVARRSDTSWTWNLDDVAEPVSVGGPGNSLAYDPGGKWLAATDSDGGLRLRRPDDPSESLTISGFGAVATDVAFHPNGKDLTTVLAATNGYREGGLPATGYGENFVRVWRCDVCGPGDEVLALARQRVTRDFTAEERRLYLA